MNRFWRLSFGAGALLGVSASASAQVLFTPTLSGDFNVYYSYAYQKVEQSTNTPSGSGIGVSGTLDLPIDLFPFRLFVSGMYQYNGEDQAEFQDPTLGTIEGLGLEDQARAGGGLKVQAPGYPLEVYGKAEYVHYRFESARFIDQFGNVFAAHDNDDGTGYFGGFRTRLPGLEFYAQGGYLNLADTDGTEFKGGFTLPLGQIIRRRATVELFAEYQWTRLHERDTAFHDIFHDYRAGIRIPFY